ncbi:MAG: tRNA (adenosine(37)-N6)-threonylcarbamoyltransferase complex dimerization subunit type 1 TsaB [Acidobacteria bacterium]|nr:tRNA (adenosine(37)-N6)-threonylcarbamoyltransferase complex dimerization subunit type 1 TsaB [Acidobacteriota bacterium]MBV9068174.1 tRNA (adenosine(37)-N6)-threonylcarbamoyltransferase complex dimerization subunit type 1 TsaB [Acidobacteriota bacterium]MBV9184135.1 tRNA (adenosine(37)-N6)-threonylcarbamoyltransferase complex dimerization subunit type 1 TsaB [Acidobacteriota bacterium]
MLILAADTSLPILSVALVLDDALLGAVALEGRSSRNEKLLPAIDWLLTEAAIERTAIDLFAITRGPGSFTGVRIGLATMQGLALALGKPVCAMSTHEAIAPANGRASIVDDAGRGEFYASVFDNAREVIAPHLAKREEVDALDHVIRVADVMQRSNVAVACARRAREIELRGDGERYRDITPIYVRLAEAEVKLQQK